MREIFGSYLIEAFKLREATVCIGTYYYIDDLDHGENQYVLGLLLNIERTTVAV